MRTDSRFERVCRAMADPEFYPHAVSRLECRQTHISVVFLTGDWVYKLKKPRDLGFLDFRTLEDRGRFCRREVELNQRLSSGVYLQVVEIREDREGTLSLGSEGEVVEYAVKMAQLPEEASLASLLRTGAASGELVAWLGEVLAAFYAGAERGPDIDTFGDPEHIRRNTEENFTQIQPFVSDRIDREKWEFVRQVSRSFREDHQELFLHRIRSGRIRDGHGDLRAEHVYFHRGIQVIDCIEFNERFRYGDAALDIAFLMMDLERLGHPGTARQLLAAYARAAADPEVYALADFYAAYRAIVRLKVSCFSLEHAASQGALLEEIDGYLRLAYRYALNFSRPVLWVFCGLPASGKSTLAEMVCRALFMPLYGSDAVRKQDPDFPREAVVPFDTGMYRPLMRGRVYARLLNAAQEELRRGRSVALDATFSDPKWREAAARLAEDMKSGLIFVECVCAPETARARLARRQAGASDARLFHYDDLVRNYEPFVTDAADSHMVIDTDRSPDDSFQETLALAYALKHSQTQELLGDLSADD